MPGLAVIGKDAKLYYNSGTYASPTWVLIADVNDVSVPMTKNKADVSTRSSRYKMYGGGQLELGMNFRYLHNVGTDSIHAVFLAAYHTDTPKEFAAMDGAIATTGSKGQRGFMLCFDHSQDQGNDDGIFYNIELAPARFIESAAVVEPVWLVAA